MSQVSSAGATLTNNITPWSRTPGKPSTGTGIVGPCSSNRWQTNSKTSHSSSTDLTAIRRDETALEDLNTDFESFVGTSEQSGHMWPSPIFEAPRVTDSNATNFAISPSDGGPGSNQWSVSQFSGGSNSLLGAPSAPPVANSGWSVRGSDVPTAGLPRAITGQQQQQTMLGSSAAPGADSNRRFPTGTSGWPLGAESADLLSDDRSGLSLSLSKMAVGNGMTPGSCFQPISEYGENQLGSSTSVVPGSKSLDSTGDGTMSHKSGKKTSIGSAEVDALFSSDPEEAIRSVVNTTEPWGLNPVDQSTPWDLSELASETGTSTVSCGSPSAGDATNSTGSANPTAPRAPSLFDAPTNASGSARRIGPSSTSSSSSVLESNVWPSEPPNGTGIWESHYENLGERTARWQQNSTAQLVQGSGAFGTQATGAPHSHHPGFVATGSNQSGSRANLGQLQSNADSGPSLFRGFNRPAPGLFPATAAGANLGARPVLGTASTTHPLGASIHGAPGTGSATRSFPLNSSPGLGSSSSWSFQSGPGAPDASLNAMTGNKGRWANTGGFNRVSGKTAHNTPHLLAGQSGGSNVRWPPMGNTPHVPTGWPVNDPRRPNMMQTAGGPTGMGGSVGGVGAAAGGWTNEASFFGQPNLSMMPPSRMNQPDFPSPMGLPQPRVGGSGAAGGVLPTGQQAFRTPHSAFYPTGMNPAFPPSSSISAGASAAASSVSANNQSQQQRLFLSPQQHSHQLQQQSVLRANAMRQLINMGFPEEEVQTIFSDINTSVERALMDLRDRTCHPGLDEMIKSFAGSGLMHMGFDDALCSEIGRPDLMPGPPGARPITLRIAQQNAMDSQLSKSGFSGPGPGTPVDNLELSLHVLQQRETQILQTIMQLHSKHQELNQKLTHIRSANMPFATNPVLQELQLQAFQVAQQIDAQHAQLKHVRSQVGMLKQITVTSSGCVIPGPLGTNNLACAAATTSTSATTTPTSAFNLLTSPSAWPAPASTVGPGFGADVDPLSSDSLSLNHPSHEPQGLKMGSGSFLWESGPWSGSSGPRGASASDMPGISAGVFASSDRLWQSTTTTPAYPTRHPFATYSNFSPLVDPIWTELGDTKFGGCGSSSDVHRSTTVTTMEPTDSDTAAGMNRAVASRAWLLVHNIPPHVSVGALKAAISSCLTNYYQEQGIDAQQYLDFELHPNMSARWVLLGFCNSTESAVFQDYLESACGTAGQVNGHYGAVKPISPSDALQRLQDIQSLASRIKGLGTENSSSNNAGPQSLSVLNYVNPPVGSSNDLSSPGTGMPESTSATSQQPGDKT